jgi:hypothetical protein
MWTFLRKAWHMYWIRYHNECRHHHFKMRDKHWHTVLRMEEKKEQGATS